jgi:hypoxanthine phosphoribosyltransferase
MYDTGNTLYSIKNELYKYNPQSLNFCVLLNKKIKKEKEIGVKYVGFDVENEFVVGFGLDYNGLYRNLPYIGRIIEGATNG